jgi:SAM-dependent methyltransferase
MSATETAVSGLAAAARGSFITRQFRRPSGLVGWLVGHLMATKNAPINRLAVELLDARPGDRILEVGFGPGTAIEMLAKETQAQSIAGVDPSSTMFRQAVRRNRPGIASGRVELHQATAGDLPFPEASFTKVFAVNTFHIWCKAAGDLQDLRRVLRDDGLLLLCLRMALPEKKLFAAPGLTEERVHSDIQLLVAAGFGDIRTIRRNVGRDVTAILARK